MRLDFIQLPNKLFYGIDEEESIIQECKDFNIITTMIYLYSSNNYYGDSVFTIEDLIYFCGYKSIGKHKGENLDRMRNLLQYMIDKELIYCDVDVMKVKSTKIIKCKTNFFEMLDREVYGIYNIKYVQVPVKVIDEILNYKGKEDKIKLLFYWCYIHSRVYKKTSGSIGEGREQATWVSFDKINDDTNLSYDTIIKYNNILVDMKLLLIENPGYLIRGKEQKDCSNIYVTVDEDIEKSKMFLHEAVSRYKYKMRQQGYKISSISREEKRSKKEARKQLEEACIEEEINNAIINNIPIVEEPIEPIEPIPETIEQVPVVEDTTEPILEEPIIEEEVIDYTTFYICDDVPIHSFEDGHNEIVIGGDVVEFEGDNVLDGLFDIKYWNDICIDRVANDNILDKDVINLKNEIERYRTAMKIFAIELTRQNIMLDEEVLNDIYDDIDDVISRHKKVKQEDNTRDISQFLDDDV